MIKWSIRFVKLAYLALKDNIRWLLLNSNKVMVNPTLVTLLINISSQPLLMRLFIIHVKER